MTQRQLWWRNWFDSGRIRRDRTESEDPFESDLFRASLAGLLEGLDRDLADVPGGRNVLALRLRELPANLKLAARLAASRDAERLPA
jgi:hypothetical protein